MATEMMMGLSVRQVKVPSGHQSLEGVLAAPPLPHGLVVLAHGGIRHSPRNRYVASALHEAGLSTLLLELLDEGEAADRAVVSNIQLLAGRLQRATDWVRDQPEAASLRLGYFGAGTGAAAALEVAARWPEAGDAVVSCGGCPDLAWEYLADVQAPTLLIVGGNDPTTLRLNEKALSALWCEKELAVVPGATHLFAPPEALEEVARLASAWFAGHLGRN